MSLVLISYSAIYFYKKLVSIEAFIWFLFGIVRALIVVGWKMYLAMTRFLDGNLNMTDYLF